MKKILLTIFILFTATMLNAEDITTIDFIKRNARHHDAYTIKGILTARVGDDKYMFQDSTGSARIEIDDDALREVGLYRVPLNTPIMLRVSIDREFFERMEIEAFEIVQYGNNTDPYNNHMNNMNQGNNNMGQSNNMNQGNNNMGQSNNMNQGNNNMGQSNNMNQGNNNMGQSNNMNQ